MPTKCPNGHTDVYISGRTSFSIGPIEMTLGGVTTKYPAQSTNTTIYACRECGAKWSVNPAVNKAKRKAKA